MRTAVILIGERYGKLEVVARAEARKRQAYWICKCDCGNETKPIRAYSLTTGETRSCGCLSASPRTAEEKRWQLYKGFAQNALRLAREKQAAEHALQIELNAAKREAKWAKPFQEIKDSNHGYGLD